MCEQPWNRFTGPLLTPFEQLAGARGTASIELHLSQRSRSTPHPHDLRRGSVYQFDWGVEEDLVGAAGIEPTTFSL